MSWLKVRSNGNHASLGARLPKARTEDLVVEALDDELLVYDEFNNRAHCLSETATRVWRACDGYTTTDVIANALDLDPETLDQALSELERCVLLEPEPVLGHTRREMGVKVAKYGAVASLPFIYSTLGPVAMAAATPTIAQCLFYSAASCDGCTGICGCCCCCQGCGSASCKICYPTSLCNSTSGPNCGSSGYNCSSGPGNSNCQPGKDCCSVKSKPNCVQPCTVTDCNGHPCGCVVNGQQVGGGTCPT
jgi:hypothetical protein